MISPDERVLETASARADPLNPAVVRIRTPFQNKEQPESLPRNIVKSRTGSARRGMSTPQVISVAESFGAAFASAMPSNLASCCIRSATQDGEFAKSAPCQVIQIIDLLTPSTRRRMARHEVTLVNEPFAATGTTAEPTGFSRRTFRPSTQHSKSAECLMFEVM
jgi:hypothetical protein